MFTVFLAFSLFGLTSQAQPMEGIWGLRGTNSVKGPYTGELELRPAKDGGLNVVRIITYTDYQFENYKVQEVWTGKAVFSQQALTLNYPLKQAGFITRLGRLQRQPADFKSNLNVQARFEASTKGLETKFSDLKTSEYSEWLTTRRELEEKPLWQDQRTKIDAKGPKMPLIVRAVIKAFKMKIAYEKDPLVKSYKDRPEYKNENPYLIFDPTDYEFYQKNKDILRVTNKITDDISLTETLVRRNAYAPSLEEKAQGYEKNARERHIDASGMYVSLQVGENNEILRENPEGDSTLWTGMYVGSQAMRYQITHEPEALENVRKSLKAMFLLMDITGDPTEFARTVRAYDPHRPLTGKWRRGTGAYAHLDWMSGGNNDMLKGITHSFLWASEVIPRTDTEIWNELKVKSRRLINLNVLNEKPQNRPVALGLAALINNDTELRKKYIKSYKSFRVRISGYDFNTDFYWHGSADWSGINLGLVGDITNITLADRLGEIEIRDKLRERMMDAWVVYQPARRHLMTLATYSMAYRHGTRGDKFRDKSNDSEFEAMLEHSLWGLREIPYPRPTDLDVSIDHSLSPEWCLSPIPRLFWKAIKRPEPPVDYFYQGFYDYPIFEQDAFNSTFIWKSAAFNYRISHKAGDEYAGIDYLYAYWLSRHSGVLP